jgi:hypothetical protein
MPRFNHSLSGSVFYSGESYLVVSQWVMWFINDLWDFSSFAFDIKFSLDLLFSFHFDFELPEGIALSLSTVCVVVDVANELVLMNFLLGTTVGALQRLSPGMVQPVLEFAQLDRDGSGTITKGELLRAQQQHGRGHARARASQYFEADSSLKELNFVQYQQQRSHDFAEAKSSASPIAAAGGAAAAVMFAVSRAKPKSDQLAETSNPLFGPSAMSVDTLANQVTTHRRYDPAVYV